MTKKYIFIIAFFIAIFIQNSFSIRRDTIFYKQFNYDVYLNHENSNIDSFFVDTIALIEDPMQMLCKNAIIGRTYGWSTLHHINIYFNSVYVEKTSFDELRTDITFDSIYSIVDYKDSILISFYTLSLFDRCDFLCDLGYCPDLNEIQLRYYPYAVGDIEFGPCPIYKLTYKIGKERNYLGRNKKNEPFVFKVYHLPRMTCY